MTISTTTTLNRYTGNGSTTVFPFIYRILAATDLVVTKLFAGTLVPTTLNYPADYTVSGVGNATGGSITLTAAPATGDLIVIERVMAVTQPTSIRNNSSYFAETHENVFDRGTMVDQQQATALARTFSLPKTVDPSTLSMTLPVPVSGQVLTWAPTGLTNAAVASDSVVLPGVGRTTSTLSSYLANNYVANVLDYDADPTGVSDNLAAFNSAINGVLTVITSLASGTGVVYVPAGTYLLSAQLVIPDNIAVMGVGERASVFKASASFPINTPVVRLGRVSDVDFFHCRLVDVGIDCNNVAGSIGIYSNGVQEHSGLRDVLVVNFVNIGVQFETTGCQNFCVDDIELIPGTSATSGWRGMLVDTVASNNRINKVTVNGANTAQPGSGIEVKGGSDVNLSTFHPEHVTTGLLVTFGSVVATDVLGGAGMTDLVKLVSGTAVLLDLNPNGATNAINNTVSGRVIAGYVAAYNFSGDYETTSRLRALGGQANTPTNASIYAASNASVPAIETTNSGARSMASGESVLKAYNANASDAGAILSLTSNGNCMAMIALGGVAHGFITPTYGTSVATNAALGNIAKITVTNGTAFTIANPTNLRAGAELAYDILNSSGGAMGAVTWDTLFKLAGAFTNPANTKRRTIKFYYDGTSLVELTRAGADI